MVGCGAGSSASNCGISATDVGSAGAGTGTAPSSSTGSARSVSVFFFSALVAASAFGAVTVQVGIRAGRSSLVPGYGHTAAHRARQAVNTAAMVILFFILLPPLWM